MAGLRSGGDLLQGMNTCLINIQIKKGVYKCRK
jgi:hypothetical protein